VTRATQLSAFADQDPDNPILLCDLLDELLACGNLTECRRRLEVAPPTLANLPEVRFRAARVALQAGDFATAAQTLQALIEQMKPVPAGIVHDLAYAQMLLGQPEQALHTLDAYRVDETDATTFALLRARALHHLRRHLDAVAVLDSIQSSPRMAEICGLRSMLWLDEGDTARARAEARRALQLDPNQHEAAIVEGTLALWERRVDESTAMFEKVLAHHPNSGRALLGLGQDTMLRGRIPDARALIQRAAQVMPDHLGTLHALAWCQLLEGDLAGAKQSFDKAFIADRTFGETHGGLALVHALRGERTEAEAAIKRAMRLDPRGRSARYATSVLLLDEGRVDEARQEIDRLMAMSPGVDVAVPADFIFRLRELVRPRG